jgi:crotonobetaine/carnitine-CoA ligase
VSPSSTAGPQEDGRGSSEPRPSARPLPPDAPRWHTGYREAADDEMPVADRTVTQVLARRVAERPDAPFVAFEDREGRVTELSYGAFAAHVERLAAGLASIGVGRGDRILIQLPNCVEFVATIFAAGRLGAMFVPSNTANRESEVRHLLQTTRARHVVTVAEHRETVAAAAARAQLDVQVVLCRTEPDQPVDGAIGYGSLLDAAAPAPPADAVAATDPLEIMFSSGTTSRPKGVVATHTNLLTSGRRQAMSFRVDRDDRYLTVLPLFHASAQSTTLFAALASGASAVFLERYSASRFWGQVRAHGTTRLTLVAMLLRTLMAQPPDPTDRDHRLRSIGYATNMTEAAQAAFEERFAIGLTNAYGLTEAMTEVTIAPLDGPRRWPSIGVPTMDRAVRIVGEDGTELPPRALGEIQIHGVPGETIMREYYGDPEATAWALRDGWLRTRDIGWMDEHGYVYFSDRDVDLIKSSGENVSATEVEAVLLEHPGIDGVAVIGVEDPVRDEVIKAFVVPVAGVTLTIGEIQEFCAPRLARFKIPAMIELLPELPTNSVGKIDKKLLRAPS